MQLSPLQILKSDFFRALAHPIRIAILEQLAGGERSVHDLQAALALPQPIVSQQLAALRAKQIVSVRREGQQAFYTLRHPLVAELLRVARELLNRQLSDSQGLLKALQRERRRA